MTSRYVGVDGRRPTADDDRRRTRRAITQSELDEWAEGEPTLTHDAERSPRLLLAGARHVCTRAYPNMHREMAFSVGGRRDSDGILREHWERFAQAIDVRERLVFRELERMLEVAEDTFERTVEEFRDEFGNSPAISHVSKAVHKRIRAMRTHV